MRSFALIALLAACGTEGTGSLELTLTLPTEPELRPTGMTTVTVTASAPGESPLSTTSVLADNRFAAGELPLGQDVQIGVVLRDVSNRIVGVGQAGQPIDIVGDQPTRLSIPVRRPFVYASSDSALVSFDPTLDPRDPRFQGTLAGITAPRFTISVGGDRLAVVTDAQVHVVETATNAIRGMIPVPAGTRDAAAVPGTAKLAVAHTTGITIVDLDTSAAVTAEVGPVDRVTVGLDAGGALVAYGLVGRVAPPEKPDGLATCTGESSLVAVAVDAPMPATPRLLGAAVSDLAAAPDQPLLFASLPCEGKVASIAPGIDHGPSELVQVSALERAAVLTVAGDRVWAAGTTSAVAHCSSGECTPAAQIACPTRTGPRLGWVTRGANIVVQSIPLTGGEAITLSIPERRETIVDGADPAGQHAQVLKPLGVVPLDLVALPGGQSVALVTQSRFYIEDLVDADFGFVILPCLDVTTADWLLVDLATSSVAQRVRTSCTSISGQSALPWTCETPPAGEQPAFDAFIPISVGALFGAR